MRFIFTLMFSFLILFSIASCDSNNGTEGGNDDLLTQMQELRNEVTSLKADLVALDAKVDNIKVAAPEKQAAPAPKQVKLNQQYMMGNDDAKVAIVEFTDFQCPFCARHSKSVLVEIKEKLVDTGKIQYMVMDFPLGFHDQAKSASVAANCAGDQGQYWAMHDVLFYNVRGLNDELYQKTAADLGLDLADFKTCLEDPESAKAVDLSIAYGNTLGVTGTPKFFVGNVNGDVMTDVTVISGAQGFDAFNLVVEALLKESMGPDTMIEKSKGSVENEKLIVN